MPGTITVTGLDDLGSMLTEMANNASGAASRALYEGAGVVADTMKQEVGSIRTEPFRFAKEPGETRLPSPEELAIVKAASAGIAKFRDDGTEVDTSVGFKNAGYAYLVGKRVPIPKIVNAINSGTSFMQKQPFVRKAATKATTKAVAAIQKRIEAEFDAIGKGN